MKWAAPIFVLIALLQYTAPDGSSIYVNRDQIVAIGGSANCGPGSGSRLFTANSAICVKESIEQAVNKFLVEPAK